VKVFPGVQSLIDGLTDRDNNQAYECLRRLQEESAKSSAVYAYFDTFAAMLDSPNSYIRTRGLLLIAANAVWDEDNTIDEIIDRLLKHITDEKPITSRQCIKVLPVVAKHKPELRQDIENALHHADLERYNENMRSLVMKDIQKALADLRVL